MSDLSTITASVAVSLAEIGQSCGDVLDPAKVKIAFEKETTVKKPFGQADKASGAGDIAILAKPQACQDSLDKLATDYAAFKTTLGTLGASAAAMLTNVTNYENQFKYAQNAYLLASIAGASATDAAFTQANAVIGICIYQPTVSETATCWGYTKTTDSFDGYQMTPALWNGLDNSTRKLNATILAGQKMGTDPIVDYFKQWRCTGLDPATSTSVEAGQLACLCQRVIPGANSATATDPSYKLGDMTVFVYNSTRTTAQAANRKLHAATGFQGNEFYSYSVNTGAVSGLALSAAAISALVLSHF